ncbi:nodal homolog 2-A-like [Gastrophryne carolinensis]
MTLKTVLHFMSIYLVLGRPPLPLDRGTMGFSFLRANSQSQGARVPPYMMHLYQTLVGERKDHHKPETHIVKESDTVQSLPAKSCIIENNHWSVIFDLTSISQGDDLQLVELRLHFPSFKTPSNINVEIFDTKNKEGRVFLGSVTATMPASPHSTWKSFNVTKMMEQHLQWGKKVTTYEGKQGEEKSHSAHVATSHYEFTEKLIKRNAALQKTSTNQAIIVFFSKEKQYSKSGSSALIEKMAPKALAGFRRQRRNRNDQLTITSTNTYPMAAKEQHSLCKRADMMVDFKEIGWDNWIIYPKKYNAYRCVGTCNIPLQNKAKTTNYDYIKSFLQMKEWEGVECSSCVPVKMRPLSMLFHEDSDLVLRHHDDMIIEECGVL